MNLVRYLESAPYFELTKYDSSRTYKNDAVQFSGTPRKHPYDDEKIILISSPFSSDTVFFEFRITDILHIEEMPNLATDYGDNVVVKKLWIKKGSLGMRYQPFEVSEPLTFLKDTEILHQA
jgi:hypothetical protein